ncbi:MAG: endopeptidase La [Gammaproteobacteria bacterium]
MADNNELIIDQAAPNQGGAENLALPAPISFNLPTSVLLLPLQGRPFFPAQSMPIVLDESQWRETMQRVQHTPNQLVGLVMSSAKGDQPPSAEQLAKVGTLVRVHHPVSRDGHIQFIAEGLQRFTIQRWVSEAPPFIAEVTYPPTIQDESNEIRAYAQALINKIKELIPLNPLYRENVRAFLERFDPKDASPLADFAAALTSASGDDLQEVLETVPLLRRMEKVMLLVQNEVEVANLQSEIQRKVEEQISENQREFFLKEQLKEIQKQLGISKDDKTLEIEKFKERVSSLELPEAAQARFEDEISKLSLLETGSPEFGVTRNYLDVLTQIPWGKYSEDKFDLDEARAILERDHEALDDVKQRIIEFLAVGSMTGRLSGSIVLLVGPPGVGKTSIGRSIADALSRKFYRFSLGGMRDEAEIKGHRRTYIGAMPGKFIQAISEAGVANPVIMLDEIDKVGQSYQGDPAAALLEVLDPEQNSSFLDHYLDVRFDLSKVLFICTANQIDTIPRALLDRMEVIRLSGYVAEEKLAIAKKHLWPKQRKNAGLLAKQITLTDSGIRGILDGYAREAGVRNLEKQLGKIARKAVVQLLETQTNKIKVDRNNLEDYLGPAVFKPQKPNVGLGVVTGLAWTAMGGATLDVEASKIHEQSRGFKLTGQLGDVMRESAEIAYSFVMSNLSNFDAPTDFFDNTFVHLHVPEGATPKDGPSAGVTMASALISLARGQQLKRGIAMTGELTLTGRVLAVGGIREKLIAAKRSGVKHVLLPAANEGDYEVLPDYIKAGLKVDFAERFEDIAKLIF